jgi:plastocyanin
MSSASLVLTIKDLAFAPQTLTVAAGATVTWVFKDGAIAHDGKGDGFTSKVQSEGPSVTASLSLAATGTCAACTPNMTGVIEVTR